MVAHKGFPDFYGASAFEDVYPNWVSAQRRVSSGIGVGGNDDDEPAESWGGVGEEFVYPTIVVVET